MRSAADFLFPFQAAYGKMGAAPAEEKAYPAAAGRARAGKTLEKGIGLVRTDKRMRDRNFWKGKKVLVTGHTGFKGAWMCSLLELLGAEVTGYALQPPTDPSLYALSGVGGGMDSVEGDIRDLAHLQQVFEEARPEIVIHMAAQPIVRTSYREPVCTYETNVMGTVHVLDCLRRAPGARSFVNVTTDKVYRNREWCWGYREEDVLGGHDPYSNSKACSELVTSCFRDSFFQEGRTAVSTARAGNVIGGGDFAPDRIVPDCVRAAWAGETIFVRNPHSVRPYQHVLEPVTAYLTIARRQYQEMSLSGSYNVGPEEGDCLHTGEVVSLFCDAWRRLTGKQVRWETRGDDGPHEAGFLKLDCARMRQTFGWKPVWHLREAMEKTVEVYLAALSGGDTAGIMAAQIREYLDRQDAEGID